MADSREAYVGIDAAEAWHAVAIADDGRHGEVRYLGELDATPESMRRPPVVDALMCLPRVESCWAWPAASWPLSRLRRQRADGLLSAEKRQLCALLGHPLGAPDFLKADKAHPALADRGGRIAAVEGWHADVRPKLVFGPRLA
jgi:hypothetical protein